jgi:hypothetical protein
VGPHRERPGLYATRRRFLYKRGRSRGEVVREIRHVGYSAAVNKEKPETAESDAGPENTDDDVVSDPARSAGGSGDWSDEGGATPSGPADTGDHSQ